jgi:superfamily I DNA/RNA helicase
MLRRLSNDWSRVTVVGDPRQAIYGWRAARPDSLRLFPYLPDRAHLDHALQQNYRSTPAICTLANLALHRSEFAVEAPLEAARPADGDMRARGEAEVALHLVPRIEDEATLVASEMARLIAQGAAPTTIALLLRQRTHLPVFAAALEAAGVPYTVGGGSGFFRQPAVRLLGSLLQLLRDPEDRAAAAHILESPLVGLELGSLGLYVDTRLEPGYPWWHWLYEPTATLPDDLPDRETVAQRLAAFRSFYAAAREHMLVLAPCDLLVWLAGASGLSQWWRMSRNHQAARDFDKLAGLAVQWTALAPGLTLDGFTERLRQRIEAQPREAVPVEYAADAVAITTVHGAKGREWRWCSSPTPRCRPRVRRKLSMCCGMSSGNW